MAIFGVLLHHTRGGAFWRFHGYRGVWVFFVLSGFLITTLALRQTAQLGRFDLRAFAIRRICRIMPLYYLTLGVYFVAVLIFGLEPRAQRLQDHVPAFLLYSSEFPISAQSSRFLLHNPGAWASKRNFTWPGQSSRSGC